MRTKKLILSLFAFCILNSQLSTRGQVPPTNAIVPVTRAVMTDSNSVLKQPTNFFAANSNLLNAAVAPGGTNGATLSGSQTFSGAKAFTNTGNAFTGSGAGLSALPSASLTGTIASNLIPAGLGGTFTGSFTGSHTGNAAGLTNLDPGISRVSDFFAASDPVDAALHQWTNRLGTLYFPNTPANNFTGFTLTAPFTAGFNGLVSTLDIEGQNNGSSVWNWTGNNGVMLKYGVNNNTPVNLNNITLNGSGGTGTNFGYIQTSINQGGLGPINWNNVTLANLSVGAEIFNSGGFFYGENQWSCGIGMFFPTFSDNQIIDIRSIGSTNAGLVMEGKGNRVNYNGSGEQIGILIGKGGNAQLQVSAETPSNCVVGIGYPPGSTIFPKQTLATSAGHIDPITICDGYVLNASATNAASDNLPAFVKLWDEPDALHIVDMSITGITGIISRTNIADNTPMTFDGASFNGGSNNVQFSDGSVINTITSANHVGINVGDLEYLVASLKYQRDTSGNIWSAGDFASAKSNSGLNGTDPMASTSSISYAAGSTTNSGMSVYVAGSVTNLYLGVRGVSSLRLDSGDGQLWFPFPTTTVGGHVGDVANFNVSGFASLGATGSLGTGITNLAAGRTLTIADGTIIITATGQTFTLPNATFHATGREYVFKLVASGSATIATTSSQLIDAATTYSLSAQYKYVHVQSDGTQWWIIANN